jgi:acetylornithine deacetylase/succinyl-diaminopimelate desuccinylase-like protein
MDTPWVPLAVTRIHGGTAINVVPDRCTVDLGYRPLPGTDPLDVFRALQARLAAALGPRLVDVHAHVRPDSRELDAWRRRFGALGAEVDTTPMSAPSPENVNAASTTTPE